MTPNIPTNRGQFERKSDDTKQEGAGIQAQNFGGLNTVSSPLSIPYEDSPSQLNVSVDVSGSVEKRSGTRVTGAYDGVVSGVTIVPITTGLGYAYQIVKRTTGLDIFELAPNASLNLRMTKANVWSSGVSTVKATYATTNEPEARVIFCTGGNVPVQVRFTERRLLVVATLAQTVFTFPDAERHGTSTSTNTLVYVDGVLRAATYSYNAGTRVLTLTLAVGVAAGNRVIDLELITWQWWAESVFFFGDRFWDTTTRFHDKLSDRHVAIPANLRDAAEPRIDFPNLFPFTVMTYLRPNFTFGSVFVDRIAVGFNNYVFSDGSGGHPPTAQTNVVATALQTVFTITTTDTAFAAATTANSFALYNNVLRVISAITYAGTTLTVTFTVGVPAGQANVIAHFNPEPITPSPFFVTFGAVDPLKAGTATTIYISRQRQLPFNGGNGVSGSNLYVQRDAVVQAQNIGMPGNVYGDYRLYNKNASYTQLLTAGGIGHDIDFTGGVEAGVPANARMRITNREVGLYVGTAASNLPTPRTDGSWVPCYGLGSYANYATGSFPRNVCLFQSRLCFSGFPQNPLVVAMSSAVDSTIPGEYYASFQQDVLATLPTDPLDVVLSGAADDYITGIAEYQGSLFSFTRRAVYRVSTSGRGTVTADNVSALSVATQGLVNPFSLCTADDTLMLLSDDGVYAVVTGSSSQETTEYRLEELSTKVRNKFTPSTISQALSWMAFDRVDKSLVVALATTGDVSTASTLLVFGMFRQTWTEYDTPGRFNTFVGVTVSDTTNKQKFLMAVSRVMTAGVPQDTTFLQMHDERYLDYITRATGTGSPQTLTIQPRPIATYTVVTDVQDYLVSWRMLPMLDVQDCHVTVDAVVLVFGVDYIKTPGNNIRILTYQLPGSPVVVAYRRPDTDYETGRVRYATDVPLNLSHAVLYADNALRFEPLNFTVSDAGVVTTTAPSLTVLEAGSSYASYHMTPLFTWGTLKAFKRLMYWLGFFDNTFALDTYALASVNTASGQPAQEIVGMPRTRLDCNVSFVYNAHDTGDTSVDVYGFQTLVWDASLFDVFLPTQTDNYVLLKNALQGVGYSFQGIVWSMDECAWRLVGYQLDGKQKGTKYSHWSN